MNETIVYIGRSDVHEGKLVDLGAGIRHLAEVAERLEPQLISHRFRVDESAHRMTVVVVHTDSAWLVTIRASWSARPDAPAKRQAPRAPLARHATQRRQRLTHRGSTPVIDAGSGAQKSLTNYCTISYTIPDCDLAPRNR